MTFFSSCAVGTTTVLCRTSNTLLPLCVVPSVSVTDYPLADCTTCTSSLERLLISFLNNDVSEYLAPVFETRSTAKQVGLVWRGVKFGFKRIVTYNEGWGFALHLLEVETLH